jgi:pimeloyl-ACP methyl ester carboxylesterase
LASHPAVLEVGVVGAPDAERQEIVAAFVALVEGVAPDGELVASLQQHARDRIAPYKYPRRVRFVDRLPRDPVGKLQPRALKTWASYPVEAKRDAADPGVHKYTAATTSEGMWYQRAGSGRPIVLVHGWSLSSDMWRYEPASLGEGHDVLLVDLPGFGRSCALPGPYTIERHADALIRLLGEASLDGAIVVGFAYGAAVAMRAAIRDPARVAGLVCIGIPRAGTLPDERMLASMGRDWARYVRRSAEALVPGAASGEAMEWLASIMGATRVDVAQETWQDLSGFDPVIHVRELRVPALFVHGADDVFAPVAAAEECAAATGSALCIIPGAGHLVVFDRPELREAVIGFASQLRMVSA